MNRLLVPLALALLVPGCASRLSENEAQQKAEQAFRTAFTHGNPELVARVMEQDEVQQLCTKYRNQPPKDVAERIEKSQAATIVYPASGRLIGDWREGEKIAQDGYGFRFTDTNAKRPNGGNCYACHRIGPQEISFGTLGPSLYGYGRQRGAGEAIQRYTYGKIYNSEAFSACSNMPRLGYHKVLTPEQIAHVVALLLDPDSPVNK
jgi:L-cysteine S-thiosulfotransferase